MDYNLGEFNFNPEVLQKVIQNNILLYFVVLLLVLKIITVGVSINFPQNIFFADITKTALENFANETRQSLGLQPLTENSKLDEAAQLKAENMVQDNYFAHTSPQGLSPWYWFLQAGYNYKYAGENLAIGFFDSQEVYQAWLNSPEHKANILNPNYKEFGTAVVNGFGQNNTIVVVQEFGSQLPLKTTAVNNNTKGPASGYPAAQPVVKPTQPAAATTAPEKVLSQSTETKNTVEPAKTNSANNLYSKILNSVLYNYDTVLQDIIYGVSLAVIGILLALILFNFKIDFKKEFVFRSVVIIALLSLATLINRDIIILIIPHKIII